MGVYSGPDLKEDGLVLSLDAANSKGFDKYENLLAYSEDFSNAYWAKSNVSVTSNAITSPTGSSNASKLVESATTAVHELNRAADPVLSSGLDNYITFSIFAKAAERQYCYIRATGNSKRIAVVVDLSNGTFNVTNWGFTLNSSATVTPYPNGWYRITATAQSNYPQAPGWFGAFYVSPLDTYQSAGNVGGSGYSYAGNGTSGIYIWGAHYEFGPGISDYYATTGTTKTRGSTLIDLTGRGNTGTLVNGPTYSSSNNGSIVFDGTDDYVNCGTSPLEAGNISVFTWIYPTSFNNTWNIICTKWFNPNGSESRDFHWALKSSTADGTNLRQNLYTTSNNDIYGTTAFSINTWYYVGFTIVNGGTLTFYKNGVTDGTSSSVSRTPQSSNLQIGDHRGVQFALIGRIPQVSIYNRALTAAEIKQNFNATRARYGI